MRIIAPAAIGHIETGLFQVIQKIAVVVLEIRTQVILPFIGIQDNLVDIRECFSSVDAVCFQASLPGHFFIFYLDGE